MELRSSDMQQAFYTESSLHATQKKCFFYSGDKQDNIFHWNAYN